MNADQVIEGIGKAVEAAKPAQEYCLFYWNDWPMCMTKAEWAGWMQAGGALLAIVATWYITSAQQRAQRNKELQLAALDASTMLEEVLSARASFADVQSSLGLMLCFPDDVFVQSILGLHLRVGNINLRPLRDQDRLVHVGSTYLGKVAVILEQISSLKGDAEEAKFMFEYVREDGFEKLKAMLKKVEAARMNCTDAARLLQAFAESHGIKLSVTD